MYFKFNAAVAVAAVLALLSVTTATPVAGDAVDCARGTSQCTMEDPNGRAYEGCCGPI